MSTYIKARTTYIKDRMTYIKARSTYIKAKSTYIKDRTTYIKDRMTYIKARSTYIKNRTTYIIIAGNFTFYNATLYNSHYLYVSLFSLVFAGKRVVYDVFSLMNSCYLRV
jgi:hypothetical protein